MRKYFYKINKKYIENFSRNVFARFRNENIRSNVTFIKSIFNELNKLFQFISGQMSSKNDIPKETDYPDTNKFNNLVQNISYDIEKIYTAQKLVEDDLNNLINFNSSQRNKTFGNLTSIQQKIYSIYIKNKKGINGEVILPVGNPFTSFDNLSPESKGIAIDETRSVLSLSNSTPSSVVKPVDLSNIQVYFAEKIPKAPLYPNNKTLALGAHWKLDKSPSAHFITPSQITSYRNMMIDNPTKNTGVGYCEFEAVKTLVDPTIIYEDKKAYRIGSSRKSKFNQIDSASINTAAEHSLKHYIGTVLQKDSELIYLDINNSLQGKYVNLDSTVIPSTKSAKYKLVIPFTNKSIITNEIDITFQPDALGQYPKIVWKDCKVFSNINGTDISYSLIGSNKVTDNGVYKCLINSQFIKPSRLELILEYTSDDLHWKDISFYMSHYVYDTQNSYSLGGASLILRKSYDVYVDEEADQDSEKNRALNVLLARRK